MNLYYKHSNNKSSLALQHSMLTANNSLLRTYHSLFITLLTISILLLSLFSRAQDTYQHITDDDLYSFMDELADDGVIELNSVVKPYGRKMIGDKLQSAVESGELLPRQRKEALLYLHEFGFDLGDNYNGGKHLLETDKSTLSWMPPVYTYADSVGRVAVRPVYGIRYISNGNNNFYHSYGGAEMWSQLGEHWGIYASLRDNYQQKEILARPSYFTHERGGAYKINVQNREGGDFSEMRGGVTYSGKWGHVGLVKDHVEWGTNYNGSNIFSGRTPSFAMIKLQLKPFDWLQFDYHHGWLVSEVVDSLRSYITANGDLRERYHEKYIAANMYTIKPFNDFHLAIGNSIVYSDIDFQPAYLIPFFFFKSLDHTINHGIENQNSQMFFNVSSRNINHLHVFASVFYDEFSVTRVNDPDRHNFYSVKGGVGLSNWPVSNVGLQAEFTRTAPLTYKHRVPATTFATNDFNLGHYLKDNSEDYYVGMWYKPHHKVKAELSYSYSQHGRDHSYVFGDGELDEKSFLEEKTWDAKRFKAEISWHPSPAFSLFAEYNYSDIRGYELDGKSAKYYLNRFTPNYLHGKTNTVIVGMMYSR